MAPKKKNKHRGRRSKTRGTTSASDPNPIATSPSASSPTGDGTSTSLVPSSAFPSAPPTTTTAAQLIPSAQPQPTSLLPSSSSQITTTTEPLPSAPPLPIQETHQERVSCTSDGATTTDVAGPSTAPSASAKSKRTRKRLPITNELMRLLAPAVSGAMEAVHGVKEADPVELQELVVSFLGLQLEEMESVLGSVLVLADRMNGKPELKATFEALDNMEVLWKVVGVTANLLKERKKRDGSGGSEGEGGGPDRGSGDGDGEGGGVSV